MIHLIKTTKTTTFYQTGQIGITSDDVNRVEIIEVDFFPPFTQSQAYIAYTSYEIIGQQYSSLNPGDTIITINSSTHFSKGMTGVIVRFNRIVDGHRCYHVHFNNGIKCSVSVKNCCRINDDGWNKMIRENEIGLVLTKPVLEELLDQYPTVLDDFRSFRKIRLFQHLKSKRFL